jgi:hypothetical protein
VQTLPPLTTLIIEAWRRGLAAGRSNLIWLALFALTAGVYSAALVSAAPIWLAAAAAGVVFAGGVRLSQGLYARLLNKRDGGFLALAHANAAVYLAFLFVGTAVLFFLAILPGILIEAQGRYELDGEASAEQLQAALIALLPTPYGAVLILCSLAGIGALAWLALRLVLFGAATIDHGAAHVFRTFGWTRSHVLALALAAAATHALPFALAAAASAGIAGLMPETLMGAWAGGTLRAALFVPFLLAGHGLAAAAYERLKPDVTAARLIGEPEPG